MNTKLLNIKEVEIGDKKFFISEFPGVQGVVFMIRISAFFANKMQDVEKCEPLILSMMNYCAVEIKPGFLQQLSTESLVQNHVGKSSNVIQLLIALVLYNQDFVEPGGVLRFLRGLVETTPALEPLVTKMLNSSLAKSLLND